MKIPWLKKFALFLAFAATVAFLVVAALVALQTMAPALFSISKMLEVIPNLVHTLGILFVVAIIYKWIFGEDIERASKD